MLLMTILSLIGTLLPTVLKYTGLSANIDNLIAAAVASIGPIVTAIQAKQPVSDTILTVLEDTLAVLASDTSLDPVISADIAEGVRDLSAGIAAYKAAQINTDPSTLTPIPTV